MAEVWVRVYTGRTMAGTQHSSEYKALIQRLVEARKAAKLSQAALAERLGKPASFVAKVELSERRFDVVEFFVWCQALSADPTALLAATLNDLPSTMPK